MGLTEYIKDISTRHPSIAYGCAALGYSSQAITQIAFKYVTATVPPFHALFIRAFMLFCLSLVFLHRSRESPYIKSEPIFRKTLMRLLFSTSFVLVNHYCVKYLPVSTVSSLGNVGPIFIFFIEAVYYKKPLNKISLGFTLLCFLGVLLILQPEFLFDKSRSTPVENFEFLVLLVIFGAFCFSMAMIYIHDLANKVTTLVNLHYSYVSHMLFCAVLSNLHPPVVDPSRIDIQLVLAFAVVLCFALVTHYMIYTATTLKPPSHIMPFGYLGVVVGFTADIIFFGSKFNTYAIVGMLLTSLGLISKLFVTDAEPAHNQAEKAELKQKEREERRASQEEEIEKI